MSSQAVSKSGPDPAAIRPMSCSSSLMSNRPLSTWIVTVKFFASRCRMISINCRSVGLRSCSWRAAPALKQAQRTGNAVERIVAKKVLRT
jgi:hypothetical protein